MRLTHLCATAAACAMLALPTLSPAHADGWETTKRARRHAAPVQRTDRAEREELFAGWSRVDPYAYQYEPRGYYPYYNSGYWRPNCLQCAPRYQHPPYWAAWGYTPAYGERPYEGRIAPWHW